MINPHEHLIYSSGPAAVRATDQLIDAGIFGATVAETRVDRRPVGIQKDGPIQKLHQLELDHFDRTGTNLEAGFVLQKRKRGPLPQDNNA